MPVTSLDIASPMALVYDDYNSKLSWVLGAAGILIGVMTVAWDIVAIAFSNVYATAIGYGLWSGVIFCITGGFGIAAAHSAVSWRVITFMVLSIASVICAAVTFCLGVVDSVTVSVPYFNLACNSLGSNCVKPIYDDAQRVTIAMTALLAAMGGIMSLIATCGACLGCRVACCGKSANAQIVQYVQRA
jgi:small-conductance mechanosensitive channel